VARGSWNRRFRIVNGRRESRSVGRRASRPAPSLRPRFRVRTRSPYALAVMSNDQREVRLQKLAALVAAGIRPYADRFPTTHALDEARREAERAEGTPVRVAGRVMTARAFGKLTFAHLLDA